MYAVGSIRIASHPHGSFGTFRQNLWISYSLSTISPSYEYEIFITWLSLKHKYFLTTKPLQRLPTTIHTDVYRCLGYLQKSVKLDSSVSAFSYTSGHTVYVYLLNSFSLYVGRYSESLLPYLEHRFVHIGVSGNSVCRFLALIKAHVSFCFAVLLFRRSRIVEPSPACLDTSSSSCAFQSCLDCYAAK